MKAKVIVTSLLIAVLSGCAVSEPTSPFTAPRVGADPPLELFRQPPLPRKIALPGIPVRIISSREFVAIELDAGAISQGTAAAATAECPDEAKVETLGKCLTSFECGSLADLSDLQGLLELVSNAMLTGGILGDQMVIVANNLQGMVIVGDASNPMGLLTSATGSRELPGATASMPSTVVQVMGSASIAVDLPCGGKLESPCQPLEQCPGGSSTQQRLLDPILHSLQCPPDSSPEDCPIN